MEEFRHTATSSDAGLRFRGITVGRYAYFLRDEAQGLRT